MRGRKERELESPFQSEHGLGTTIRAWRRFRGMSVTELAVAAGFGNNGRGYISKIEHRQIKRLGEESLTGIARALGLSPHQLQEGMLPDPQAKPTVRKETLDEAIAGCRAWLKVYHRADTERHQRLDRARTYFKLAELCCERVTLAETREERNAFLSEALQHINEALRFFQHDAPSSSDEAQHMRATIEREIHIQDLDDAITGCQALLQVYSQKERPLDWARTHAKLAQLYWDRTTYEEQVSECIRWLEKALHSLDQAVPIFGELAVVSFHEAQRLREMIAAEREQIVRSSL